VTTELESLIQRAATEAGFDLAGIAPVRGLPELDFFPGWLAQGRAGEMAYLETRAADGQPKRASLARVAPWARSVVVCALNYNTATPYSTESNDGSRGRISRYAFSGGDYHDAVMLRLEKVEAAIQQAHTAAQTRRYVDTGPIVERVFAKYAGIGWIGKNTCILNERMGSWLFLGVILTSLELAPGLPPPDRCGTCTRCLDACPTRAFPAPYQLDATRCISYLTIEKRGAIPEELREGMGRHLFGCDICQDVCPWNGEAPTTTAPEFQPRADLVNPPLDRLAALTPDDFRQLFRGSALRRAKYQGLRRNAAVAMGNSDNRAFIPQLEKLAADPDPVVAQHARWALRRLTEPASQDQAPPPS